MSPKQSKCRVVAGIGFLDLGSNIGSFAVHLAHAGFPTVAVDMNRNNLALIHRSGLANAVENTTFVNAALSNESERTFSVTVSIDSRNVGGAESSDVAVPSPTLGKFTASPVTATTLTRDKLARALPFKRVAIKFEFSRNAPVVLSKLFRRANGTSRFTCSAYLAFRNRDQTSNPPPSSI